MIKIAKADFTNWIKQGHRFAVLMVRKDDCVPCGRSYPIYRNISKPWENSLDVQFATYTIDRQDRVFVQETLGVENVPTFIVFENGQRVLSITSAIRLGELKEYLMLKCPYDYEI